MLAMLPRIDSGRGVFMCKSANPEKIVTHMKSSPGKPAIAEVKNSKRVYLLAAVGR